MLSAELYEKCEEFFELISSEFVTDEVETRIEGLRDFLLDDVDGRTNRENYIVAEEVEIQIKDLWNLLPLSERKSNHNLCDYFDDIMETTAKALDEPVLVSSDDDCDESGECYGYENEEQEDYEDEYEEENE